MGRRRAALAVAAWLVAAGAAAAPLRIGLPTAPVTLDPRYASDATSARLVRLLHCALVDVDGHGRARAAAARWQRLAPTRWRFVLDRGAHFAPGRPLTATDVIATFEAVADPRLASPHREVLRGIRGYGTSDPATVDIELDEPDPLLPARLTLGLLRAEDARAPRDSWRQGCGPFTLRGLALDRTVDLVRRRDGQAFAFVPVVDASVRALKLLGGELDLVQGSLPPELYDWLATRAGLRAAAVPGTTFSYLGMNLAAGPTARREVRAAIAHAIDRAALVRHLFRGQARLANGVLPPGHWASAGDLAAPAFDPARARALLATAGYGTRRLRLEYKTSSDHFRLRIATALQAQLAGVGIDLEILSLDWGTFYADIKAGRFALYGLSWVGLHLPDIYRQAFHSSTVPPAGANRGRYREPATDALIEAAERAPAGAARRAAWQAVNARLLYDLPYVPLWYEDQTYVARDCLSGYSTDADGSFDALAGVAVLNCGD